MNFGFDSTAEEVTEGLDLSGKTYLVTGNNSGLGLETQRVLQLRGAHVVGLARTKEKAEQAGADTAIACELSEPASVREALKALEGVELDGAILNAGIMALPKLEEKHDLELQFLTNHVGHAILSLGLEDKLKADGRLVILSSGAHHRAPKDVGIDLDNPSSAYSAWRQYGQSKLANILFAKQMAERFKGTQKTANAVHPGVIRTNLARHIEDADEMFASFDPKNLKNVGQGAATQVLVATHPELAATSGEYFSDCKVTKTSKWGSDSDLQARLWAWTEETLARL